MECFDFAQIFERVLSDRKLWVDPTSTVLILKVEYSRFWIVSICLYVLI